MHSLVKLYLQSSFECFKIERKRTMELHKNIKELRKHKGLRQEELAELMGVSTASVSKWETGQCAPELTVLMELADYFEVSVDALMGHQILGNRLTSMLDEMEQLIKSGTYKDSSCFSCLYSSLRSRSSSNL